VRGRKAAQKVSGEDGSGQATGTAGAIKVGIASTHV
jgi:hypothetical protein